MLPEFMELLRCAQGAVVPGAPATAVQLPDGTVCVSADPLGEDLLSGLKGEPVEKLLCLWADGTIDLPSFALRQALLEQNPRNGDALVVLRSLEGYTLRSLSSTMP